jgi:CheY-like chemotaxis protein
MIGGSLDAASSLRSCCLSVHAPGPGSPGVTIFSQIDRLRVGAGAALVSVLALSVVAAQLTILYGQMLTLLIVDDHEAFRAFARDLLTGEEFEVSGEATDGESALEAARDQRPDVVLLDVQLPGIDGFEVAERLAASSHPPAVVMTSTRNASDYGARLRHAPVRGFLPKHELSGAAVSALLSERG